MEYQPINLGFSGGGAKALSFIGVIQRMEERRMLNGVMNFIGTSAGAITCLMLVCGYTSKEMIDIALGVSSRDILNIDLESIMDFPSTYGLDNEKSLQRTLEMILRGKGFHYDITFLELVKITGKNLIITAANLHTRELVYFSVDKHPNVCVLKSVMASCSIPILYRPVYIEKHMYVDGGLFQNFPIDFFRDYHDTLGFTLKSEKIGVETNFFSYISNLIDSVLDIVYMCNSKKTENMRICEITLPKIEYVFDDYFNVDIKNDVRLKIIKCGFEQFDGIK